jgi:uncharacterized protein YndB with AHSA1/START domain
LVPRQPDDSMVVTRTIHIAASPETVFAFFIDPLKMRQWKAINATLSPYPGGQFQIALNEQDTIRGEYVEVVPYRRVVFTWGWDAPDSLVPPGSSTVEIDLVPDNNGTLLRLCHRGLPTQARSVHEEGWDYYLPRLALAAGGRDSGADPWTRQH